MPNPPNTRRKRGKRAGRAAHLEALKDIHSKIRNNAAHNLVNTSMTAVAADAAKYFDGAAVEETTETHIVPRRSVSRKQLLKFNRVIETEPIRGKQFDKALGRMVEVNDNRLTYKSPDTLLNKGYPFRSIGVFKRQGSISEGLNTRKTLVTTNEDSIRAENIQTEIPNALPDLQDLD